MLQHQRRDRSKSGAEAIQNGTRQRDTDFVHANASTELRYPPQSSIEKRSHESARRHGRVHRRQMWQQDKGKSERHDKKRDNGVNEPEILPLPDLYPLQRREISSHHAASEKRQQETFYDAHEPPFPAQIGRA